MSLRILYVSHSFPLPGQPLSNVGGMQRMATELHAALAAHPDVELHSLLLETSWQATHWRMPAFFLRLLRDIPRIVARERIDIVLFSSLVTAAVAVPLRRRVHRLGARLAATPVGRDATLPFGPYQRWVPRVLDALDLVLPISRATGEECLARGLAAERMEIIPCGADTSRFLGPEDRDASREALRAAFDEQAGDLPPEALLLCSVGRHQERKGFHWFVDKVLPRLPDDVVYLLAGEGPMTEQVRQAAERNGVQNRVALLGMVSERMLGTLYHGADLFVMPNIPVAGDMEGFGVVMLEAGLSGLPTVAADLEGIRDVIHEGENGTLVPTGDADAFAEAILRYRIDRQLRAAASSSAARFTADNFGWKPVAERYVEVLRW